MTRKKSDDAAKIAELGSEHRALGHAMQAGVALDQQRQPETMKSSRVGINTALVDHASLVQLLIRKGVITELEYAEAIVEGMRAEVERYQTHLRETYGLSVTLCGVDHYR